MISIRDISVWCLTALAALSFTSCDMMKEDRDDCPMGLYLQFRYEYNLQRADMFNDHVGAVDVYVFDEQGKFVKMQSEENTASAQPLKDPNYRMHMEDLQPGKYQLITLAGQDAYSAQMARSRAHFVRGSIKPGDDKTALDIRLDTKTGDMIYVDNMGAPLDTLWHSMEMTPVEVFAEKPSYGTVYLMRDTKKINVTLYELDTPTEMDIKNYDLAIYDRNSHLLWDNSVDEQDYVANNSWMRYTPHATWNTTDKPLEGQPETALGKMGHADFMTSRIINHDKAEDDAVLIVTDKRTGKDIITVNLASMLARLRNYEDTHCYTAQEFLDRCYDYTLSFYIKGDKWEYAYLNVSVNALSWAVRIQNEVLQ